MMKFAMTAVAAALLPTVGFANTPGATTPSADAAAPVVTYHNVKVRGLDIFYREAGPATAPTVLLLHGFPSSSHMFRDLIPLLATKYHVIAPDYPGFGHSSAPSPEAFTYDFPTLAEVDVFQAEQLQKPAGVDFWEWIKTGKMPV